MEALTILVYCQCYHEMENAVLIAQSYLALAQKTEMYCTVHFKSIPVCSTSWGQSRGENPHVIGAIAYGSPLAATHLKGRRFFKKQYLGVMTPRLGITFLRSYKKFPGFTLLLK